jgi:deazaflavin-dependent oxidoreductase (nitroreductase family)
VSDLPLRRALARSATVDITTTGRRSGRARRLEIWMLHVDGRFFITGTPGRRDWLANLIADPEISVHVDDDGPVTLAGRAAVVLDDDTRRRVLSDPSAAWYRGQAGLDELVASAPMVEVTIIDG